MNLGQRPTLWGLSNQMRAGQFRLRQLKLRGRLTIRPDYDFFANACGLASSLSWDYYPPHEVPPMDGGPKTRPKIDPDEYYPK